MPRVDVLEVRRGVDGTVTAHGLVDGRGHRIVFTPDPGLPLTRRLVAEALAQEDAKFRSTSVPSVLGSIDV